MAAAGREKKYRFGKALTKQYACIDPIFFVANMPSSTP